MSTSKPPENVTQIGKKLIRTFKLYDIDILREDYSTTVDFSGELSEAQVIQLEREGFEVIHEEASIYTLRYEYEC